MDARAATRLIVLLDAQKRALEMLLEQAPVAEVLAHLASTVETQSGGEAIASILLLNDEGALRGGAGPSLPLDYQAAIDGIKADPGVGTCAAAAATGEVVITENIETAPSWAPFKHLPLNIGLVAAWAMPIKARDGSVLGTFGTYFRECRGPRPDEVRSVEILSRTAAVAIEHARSEAARAATERDFRTLADNMSQLAWMADGEGQRFWFNQRWYDYTGSTFDEVRGSGWRRWHHPEHIERVQRHLDACRARGEVWEDLFPLRGRDGGYRWFLARAVPVHDAQGQVVRWFGTNTDVTEVRAAQEALLEADRRKDAFLAVLAHELRNPLAPLVNALRILRLERGEATESPLHEMMERQVGHMVRLVDDLMEVSRISRGKIELQRERIDLRDTLQSAIETSRPLIDGAYHRLHVDVPGEAIPVHGDVVRLTQVFANLLNNAARYTPDGGDIHVRVQLDEGHARVTVRDSGQGIDPSMLASVFELFVQGGAKGHGSPAGLGVGLTLARQLVEMHGGRIEARSDGLGRGAAFEVHLPLDTGAPAGAGSAAHAATPRTRARVLVVDDNHDAADSLAMLLEHSGAETEAVYDGHAALEAIARQRPDVVLLDLGMAGLDGYDTARRIRATWGREITVVALTGWNQDDARALTREAGFDAHLAKPVELGQLLATLESLREARAATAAGS